jgi:rSAM/selenodomain-associated transferase 1
MAGSADVLVVMAKYPAPGAVKTRLAERVGGAAACALYRAFLSDIGGRFAGAAWRVVWAVTPTGADLTPFIGAGCPQIAQEGGELGERMLRCFARLLREGAERVVMIGADAPHIAGVVAAAFAALTDHDAVFVPTRDGGYCLVGLRALHDIFSGVPMGSAAVYGRTRERCEALGLRWRALEASFDVDEIDDVRELSRLIDGGAVALPNTSRVLRDWQAAGIV